MKNSMEIDLKECNCGRPWCVAFDAGEGENGTSYSKEELQKLVEKAKVAQEILDSLD